MKRVIKKIGKSLIIYIVVTMMLLSNVCYGGYTSEEVGEAAGNWAEYILTTYDTSEFGGDGKLQYDQTTLTNPYGRNRNPFWNTDYYDEYIDADVWYFDCSSFATAAYNYVTQEMILR